MVLDHSSANTVLDIKLIKINKWMSVRGYQYLTGIPLLIFINLISTIEPNF